jgi:hypothetical protein
VTVIERDAVWTAGRPPAAAWRINPVVAARRHHTFASRAAWREFALVAAVYGLYTATRRISAGGADQAIGNARRVLRIEHLTGLAPEHWLNRVVSQRTFRALPADYAYASLHYVVTLIVLVWLWRAHGTAYLPARRALMTATLLGPVGFTILPLAPPRMLPGSIDTMAAYGHDGRWGSAASAPKGVGSFTNQFAAMPSLHVGWAIWCAVTVRRHARRMRIRCLTVAYPVMVVLVVLSTANHYLLDAVAGLVVLLAGFAISRLAVRLGLLKPSLLRIGA